MGDVLNLPDRKSNPDMVQMLDELMDSVRRGEIVSLCIVTEVRIGESSYVGTGFVMNGSDDFGVVGGLDQIKFAIQMDRHLSQSED